MTATQTRELRYRDAHSEALRQEMRRDPSIIVMGEDVAGGAGRAHLGIIDAWQVPLAATKGLIQEFGPQRVLDTPISEAGFMGTAVGAALTGMRPVVELMYIDFLGTCLDQLLNNAAKVRYMLGGQAKVPLTVFCRIGAGVGAAAQHSESLYSILTHIPGLKCVAPSDAYTCKGLMISAIRDDDPVVVCNHKALLSRSGPVPEEPYALPLGKGRILRPGRDVTLVGIAYTTHVCLEAAERLAQEGVDAEVVDLLSLSPLDEELIMESVSRTGRLAVVDEDTPRCSVARDIAATVADRGFDRLKAPIKCVNAPHAPVPYSRPLEQAYIPSAARVVAAVHEQLRRK
ncbi:MAG: alpha-ketoacid dehydrogenase subunit beta [Chloroflexi bacterium]|nr:alpha-ketoacid dehydrogenase subunit beta [Chloroflexota bacterium]